MSEFFLKLGGLLSTAQSYPSLNSNNSSVVGNTASSLAQQALAVTSAMSSASFGQALTMSLTSTSSESEQDFLETCHASTLLAELEDDDELPEPDEDENEDDENEDEDDFDEVS